MKGLSSLIQMKRLDVGAVKVSVSKIKE